MAIVKRIGPASAFKVGLAVYGLLGLIAGVSCSLIALAGGPPAGHMPCVRAIGPLVVIVCPIVWGIIGGLGAVISALIYNLASRWVGGLEVELN